MSERILAVVPPGVLITDAARVCQAIAGAFPKSVVRNGRPDDPLPNAPFVVLMLDQEGAE